MNNNFFSSIDHVELYTPMAKLLAYWHVNALGFHMTAAMEGRGKAGVTSYVVESHEIRLVLTSSLSFGNCQYGVKRIALYVDSVEEAFEKSIRNGAFPLKFPAAVQDEGGVVMDASIRLYDNNEIVFINREGYAGAFRPGYVSCGKGWKYSTPLLTSIDHVAAELRINESIFWTRYVNAVLGTQQVQNIKMSNDSKTGMALSINQSGDKKLTFVIAEPESYLGRSKMQSNIDAFGPGIHHLAFTTDDIIEAVKEFRKKNVEFVSFPAAYYDLLRQNDDFKDVDIDVLQQNDILIDKEGDAVLLQKFLKPVGDSPFFFYELVQRINGYNGFALNNVTLLKKAEELEIIK